ncbi:unnamed protein product [Caenorhabditis auriculariae]|uniref:Uncharacterized protein n=1 Tax=Caenorhabditis auriculariae TaxID=2777116 RepID=A0A8S1H5B7_9PELO|nr:unnamed protein product [Caenorhabditis auriculariae]
MLLRFWGLLSVFCLFSTVAQNATLTSDNATTVENDSTSKPSTTAGNEFVTTPPHDWQQFCQNIYWNFRYNIIATYNKYLQNICPTTGQQSFFATEQWAMACQGERTENGFRMIPTRQSLEILLLICGQMQYYYLDDVEQSVCTAAYYTGGVSENTIPLIRKSLCM